jgi:hypothetical protein
MRQLWQKKKPDQELSFAARFNLRFMHLALEHFI